MVGSMVEEGRVREPLPREAMMRMAVGIESCRKPAVFV